MLQKDVIERILKVSLDAFVGIKLDQVTSADHLLLLLAINGKSIGLDEMSYLTIVSSRVKSIYDIVMQLLKSKQKIDSDFNDIQIIEAAYDSYINSTTHSYAFRHCISDDVVRKTALLFSNVNGDDIADYESLNSSFKKLIVAIDNRFPILLLKFYEKYKRFLSINDVGLTNLILKLFNYKSLLDTSYRKLYVALKKDIEEQRNSNVYMS